MTAERCCRLGTEAVQEGRLLTVEGRSARWFLRIRLQQSFDGEGLAHLWRARLWLSVVSFWFCRQGGEWCLSSFASLSICRQSDNQVLSVNRSSARWARSLTHPCANRRRTESLGLELGMSQWWEADEHARTLRRRATLVLILTSAACFLLL